MTDVLPVPAAQYLRMSTELQRYSLEFQTAVIRSYAEKHAFIVVKTYTDAGKSDLVLKHREGLAQLLHDVVAGGQPYRAVLVYDVSRWGEVSGCGRGCALRIRLQEAGKGPFSCPDKSNAYFRNPTA